MYSAKIVNNGTEFVLMNSLTTLDTPVVELHAGNDVDNFTFTINDDHPNIAKLIPLISVIYVYESNKEIFRGRIINIVEDLKGNKKVTCESDLAYLLDSVMRPYSYTGSIQDFLKKVIDTHNSQVEAGKQFVLGKCNVVDSNNYINRSDTNYSSCLETLRNKLVNFHAGYLRTRYEDGKRYLDYVTKVGENNTQVIQFGDNLASFTRQKDSTSIFTVLIPLGATLTEEGELGEITETVVDITSVNGGIDYIQDDAAIAQYGKIVKYATWENVTQPSNLLTKARAYLNKSLYFADSFDLSAVDLSMLDSKFEAFKIGCYTHVLSSKHDIDEWYMLEKRTLYLNDPKKNTVHLGAETESMTALNAKTNLTFTKLLDEATKHTGSLLNAKVENATQLISGGYGGYIVINKSESGVPEEILVLDAPTKEQARNVIRLNKNGIGFSTTGYNGTYANAWTIDGNLVADYVTSGTMLADRVRGGELEVGGSGLGVNGKVSVKNTNNKELVRLDKDGLTLDSSVKINFDNVSNADQTVTQIAENYIKTTKITAENLTVNSANILGTFSADKISAGTFNGITFLSSDGEKNVRIANGSIDIFKTGSNNPFSISHAYTNNYGNVVKVKGKMWIEDSLDVLYDIKTSYKVICNDVEASNKVKGYTGDFNTVSASSKVTGYNIEGTNLTATNSTITNLTATNVSASSKVTGYNIEGTNLTTTNSTITNLTATNGTFSSLKIGYSDVMTKPTMSYSGSIAYSKQIGTMTTTGYISVSNGIITSVT